MNLELPDDLYELICDCAAAQEIDPLAYIIEALQRTTEGDVSEMVYDEKSDSFKYPDSEA
jgi:hypothetical protein